MGKAMKGRSRVVIIFAAAVLTLSSLCGFAKEAGHSTKTNAKTKTVARNKKKDDSAGSYIVRKGDTLYRIASTQGTTVAKLKSANNLKNNTIQVGQKLKIHSNTPLKTAESKAPDTALTNEWESHISLPSVSQSENSEDQPIGPRLVQAGFQFLGVRYHRGGSEETGFDCSGLVKTLFSKFNIELPRTSREQFKQGKKIDRDQLEMGDLVFFSSGGKNPTHVGIYIGENKFIHAALKAKKVIVSDLNKIWYSMRYLGARRVIWGDDPAPEPQK